MHATIRRIVITLLPCAAILVLLALAWPEPALAQQTFSIDFPKKAGLPNSCMTQEPGGSGGTHLRCPIALPNDVPSGPFLRPLFFAVRPAGSHACLETHAC